MPPAIADALVALAAGDLDAAGSEAAIAAVLDEAATEADIAALLTALSVRGLTGEALAGAARALRSRAIRIRPGSPDLLDTCGTGGTGLSTFNISTATAIVAASCGVPVAKHGNRGATSKSGSADVLEALGVGLDLPPDRVADCIDTVGIGFLYARALHPAMRAVAGVRRRLPIRTVFNLIGPLSNPAGAPRQLLGTGNAANALHLAEAVRILGTERTVIVCGDNRLDEVTLSGPTQWHRVEGDRLDSGVWLPHEFGLPEVPLEALRIDTPAESAAILQAIFDGEPGPRTDLVLANAAAALWTADRVADVSDGVAIARDALASGAAAETLARLSEFTV